MEVILAIDAGCSQSAFCLLKGYTPIEFNKVDNESIFGSIMRMDLDYGISAVIIEEIQGYGMTVGKEVFDTCYWEGRFYQFAVNGGIKVAMLPRREVKLNLCGNSRAKDKNIRQALIDRFARFDYKNGKGTIKNRDYFYGFKADVWAAFAIGCTYLDRKKEGGETAI